MSRRLKERTVPYAPSDKEVETIVAFERLKIVNLVFIQCHSCTCNSIHEPPVKVEVLFPTVFDSHIGLPACTRFSSAVALGDIIMDRVKHTWVLPPTGKALLTKVAAEVDASDDDERVFTSGTPFKVKMPHDTVVDLDMFGPGDLPDDGSTGNPDKIFLYRGGTFLTDITGELFKENLEEPSGQISRLNLTRDGRTTVVNSYVTHHEGRSIQFSDIGHALRKYGLCPSNTVVFLNTCRTIKHEARGSRPAYGYRSSSDSSDDDGGGAAADGSWSKQGGKKRTKKTQKRHLKKRNKISKRRHTRSRIRHHKHDKLYKK